MIQWKEREHEVVEMVALHDLGTIQALRNCGLLKFFRTHNMRHQTGILDRLVHMWDPDLQVCRVGTHTLEIDVGVNYILNLSLTLNYQPGQVSLELLHYMWKVR